MRHQTLGRGWSLARPLNRLARCLLSRGHGGWVTVGGSGWGICGGGATDYLTTAGREFRTNPRQILEGRATPPSGR